MALGTWAEWGRKIVDQLESQERAIRDLERAVAQHREQTNASLSALAVKAGIAGLVGGSAISVVIGYLLNRMLS
jgi:hypothetical protein